MKKYIFILLFLVLIAFKAGDNKSQYNVPLAAWSVTAGDIDLDGDNDIIIGHNYCSQTQWSGVSIMLNNGNGYFYLFDSVFLFGWQPYVQIANLNDNSIEEIIAKYEDAQNENEYIAIINDFDLSDISYFSLNTYEGVGRKTKGDINGDGNMDIVVASNGGKFWGVLYNDGAGNFSEPEYHYVNYNPNDLACDDLNDDGRDDIVICGQNTEVYFSYPDDFQVLNLETADFKSGVFIVDFDLDGLKDILAFDDILGAFTLIAKFKNIDGNSFERLPDVVKQPGAHVYSITDFNNDTLPDILLQLANFSGYKIFYNEGNFQLGDSLFVPVPFYGEGWRNCYCADMDGNGYNDIITVKTLYVYLPDNLDILFNDGHGNFVEDPVTNIETPAPKPQNQLSCYPNPFKTETTFEIKIKETAQAELSVYDLQGRLITCLTYNFQKGGQYFKIKWDGLDTGGKPCKPGPYIAYLKVNGVVLQNIKIIKV